MRSVVVLPAPFGPSRPRICPASHARSTPSTTRFPPRCFTSPRASRSSDDIDPRLYDPGLRLQASSRTASPRPVESGIIGHAVPPPEPEAGHEKRLQGPRQRPPHDGARRALGAVSRRALQEVRAAIHPARGQCPEPAGDQGGRPRDRGVLEAAEHLARRQEPPGTGLRAPPALRGGACARLRRRDASAGDGHRGHRRRRHLRHARPAGADARRPRSPGRGGARPRPQQLDARFLRAGPGPAQVRRAARVSRRAVGRRRGAARRARAGRGGGDRQSQPDQWPPRPRPPLRPAVGRGGGAGRARRLSSHRAVVAQGRHRATLRRHAQWPGDRRGRAQSRSS